MILGFSTIVRCNQILQEMKNGVKNTSREFGGRGREKSRKKGERERRKCKGRERRKRKRLKGKDGLDVNKDEE